MISYIRLQNNMELIFNPITLAIITILILVYSAIFHEIAHGFVAERLGDPTARLLGRLTLNPLPHIDPFLSILLPLLLYLAGGVILGGAKPVPVDPFNLRDGRKDMALVSLAGPLTNVILAIIAAVIFKIFFSSYSFYGVVFSGFHGTSFGDLLAFIIAQIVNLNVILTIFNMLPIPPLDGSKVFALLLPERQANSYLALGQFGMYLLLLLLFLPTGLQTLIFNLYQAALSLLGL